MDKIVLNRFSTVPLYGQLSSSLRDQINKGIVKSGEFLPTEKEMAALAGVSVVVVRQAYEFLRRAGLAVTQQGKGTSIVQKENSFEFVQKLVSSYDEGVRKGGEVYTEVLELKEVFKNINYIRNILKIPDSDHLLMITRLRSINNIKMFLWTSYLPASKCKSLINEDFSKLSLYRTLQQKLGIKILRAERSIEVIISDYHQAELLGIPELKPIFYIESIAYSENNLPIEYYQGWYPTDHVKFYFELR